MAMVATSTFEALLVFSAYLHCGQNIYSTINAAILDEMAKWIVKLGVPWVALGDWNNEPEMLERSPWCQELRARVVATKVATCRHSAGTTSVIDYML